MHPERSRSERTRREDRRFKFYELRDKLRHLPDPVCELAPTDAAFSDWGYLSGGRVLCVDDYDDTIGCVAASGSGPNVIYVDGFRSVGVEAATQWLLTGLERPRTFDGLSWVLVKYDGEGEPIETVLSA